MKKCWWMLLAVLMLSGCGSQEVFEQVGDVYQVMAPKPAQLLVDIPAEAAVSALGSGQGNALYFCDGYTLSVQTLDGGDLSRSIEALTGFSAERLTVFQTEDKGLERCELAWTCAGEGGDQVGRLVLLDDGAFHYAVTVLCPAENAGDLRLVWDTVLGSVSLGGTGS